MLIILLVALVFKLQNAASLPAESTAVSDPGPNYHYNMEHLQNQININQNNVVNIEGILESVKESVESTTDYNTTAVKSSSSDENVKRTIDNIEEELNNENKKVHLVVEGAEMNDVGEKKKDAETVATKPHTEEKPDEVMDKSDSLEKKVENDKVDQGNVKKVMVVEELNDKGIKDDNISDKENDNEHSKEERDTGKREHTQGKNKRATE